MSVKKIAFSCTFTPTDFMHNDIWPLLYFFLSRISNDHLGIDTTSTHKYRNQTQTQKLE